MAMSGPWMDDASARDNQYKYNGKELNEDFGLGWYDYGARWYDPAIGRWWAVDPLADITWSYNPYHYVSDNPVKFIDPFGLFQVTYGKNGEKSLSEAFANKEAAFNNGVMAFQVQKVINSLNCPDCLKKGDVIPGTGTRADTDETAINGASQAAIWLPYQEMPDYSKGTRTSLNSNTLDANTYLGTAAGVAELDKYKNISYGTNGKIYLNGWNGNQYVKITKLGQAGKLLGQATGLLGAGFDIYQYTSGNQSGSKTLLNLTVSVACFAIGGPAGLAIGLVYFGLDKAGVIDKILAPEPSPSVFSDN